MSHLLRLLRYEKLHRRLALGAFPLRPALSGLPSRACLGPAALTLMLALAPVAAHAQGGEQKGEPQKGQPAQQPDKDAKKVDEFAEAARVLAGPAAQPECVWLGRRVVNLLWRDDLDTAFRHLDLYDRFGCPAAHIQTTFRCVIRQGSIDPKAPESLGARVHQCWVNPAQQPSTASSQPPATSSSGTQTQ